MRILKNLHDVDDGLEETVSYSSVESTLMWMWWLCE
jgi:hypothetical protein